MTSSHTPRLPVQAPEGIKSPVATATTATITLSGLQTVNGYTLNVNDRVLVKDQDISAENGIYVALEGDWVRSQDWKVGSQVANGAIVLDNNTGDLWRANYAGVLDVGTTAVTFNDVVAGGGGNTTVEIQPRQTATEGQTVFSTPISYYLAPKFFDVHLGGGAWLRPGADFTINTNGDLILTDGVTAGTWVDVVLFLPKITTVATTAENVGEFAPIQVANMAALRNVTAYYDGQQFDLLGHTNAGVGGGTFYYDAADTTSADDNGMVAVTTGGQRLKRANATFVSIDFFGGDLAATLNACKEFKLPWRDSNRAINVATGITINTTDNDIVVADCKNVRLKRTADTTAINLDNSGDILTVSSFTHEVNEDLSGQGTTTRVSSFTVVGHSYSVGDVVRLFSDDQALQAQTTDERAAEYVVISKITGDVCFTSGVTVVNYATNIKVVKPSNAIVDFKGVEVEDDNQNFTSGAIIAAGYLYPDFDLNFETLGGQGLILKACFMATTKGKASNLKNGTGVLGYGFLTVGTSLCSFDIEGVRVRHLYTTGLNNTTANDDDWKDRGNVIQDVVRFRGQGCGAAGDTHPGAVGVLFDSCVDNKSYRGTDISGASFQDRGINTLISDCSSLNSHVGVNGIDSENLKVTNFDYNGDILPIAMTRSNNFQAEVKVNGNIFQTARLIDSNGTLKVSGRINTDQADGRVVQVQGNTDLFLDTDLNYDGSTGSGHEIINSTGLNNTVTLGDTRIRDSGQIFDGLLAVDGNDIVFDMIGQAQIIGGANSVITSSGEGAGSTLGFRYASGAVSLTNYIVRTYSTGSSELSLNDSKEPIITVRVQVTDAGGYSISNVVDGKFQGQRISITNRDTSVGSLTLETSGANMTTGPNIVLAAGESQQLAWTGSGWIRG